MSARQTTAVNQWNAATKRVVAQFLRDAQNTSRQRAFNRENAAAEAEWSDRATKRAWESKLFPSYDPRGGNAYGVDVADTGGWATGYHGHKFGEMWVYIRVKGHHNTLEYAVLNPQTGNLFVFTPEAALAPPNRVYMSEADQVRSTASGTGVAGGYLEKGFMGLSVGIMAAPLVLAASETAVGGIVITGFRTLGMQMVKQFTWSTFRQKVFTDLFVQSAAGTLKNGADWKKTAGEINLTAPLVAWLLPGSTWSAAARNSIVKATLKANTTIDEENNISFRVQLPHLDSMEGFAKYLTDIGTDAVATMAKAKLVTGAIPAARWASQAMQRTGTAAGRWIAAQRVTLGTWGTIGTSVVSKVAKDQEKKRMTDRVEKPSPAHPRQ
ncbi:hypothetical protein GCM10022409_09190 [Hymenobacter glaciei]|uniref:Uncharacterized protein n=1 Tax=Hymenobacter glaciei TaxID=877209 RepID=A0ABP7TJT7_9BACT